MSRHIDWLALLSEHRVPYIERGANVKRGEANVKCPLCSSSDPSYHLGINLQNGFWACWRNSDHRGKSPVRLLIKLLNVSYQEALEIAGLDATYVDPDGFQAMAAKLRRKPDEAAEAVVARHLRMDADFRLLTQAGAARKHWDYLDNRWFDPGQLADEYGVMAGVEGRWKDRVIFPYYEEDRLVTWTGRAVGPAEIRYRDLDQRPSEFYSGPLAIVPAKQTLFNHDAMKDGGRWLILGEGPVDALKLDCYGKENGVRAVALSTASISDEQLGRLDVYASKFTHFGVMMDMANPLHVVHSMRMKGLLMGIKRSTHVLEVPYRRKDAGELHPNEVRAFTQKIAHNHWH